MDLVSLFVALRNNSVVKDNVDEGLCYALFMVVVLLGMRFVSDMKFSAVITLGAAVQCLGFCLLRLKIRKQHGAQGVSSRSLQMFLVTYLFRLYSTTQYNGYLPVDRTGDWAYQAIDAAAACVVLSVLVIMHGLHEPTYEKDHDTCAMHWFLLVCIVLAVVVHPSLNNRAIPDIAWTAALYIEAVAMVPQFHFMSKKGGAVDHLAGHYVACVFASRLLNVSFWCHSYHELGAAPGYLVVGAQILQLVLFADFMHYYIKSVRTQSQLVLPQPLAV